MKTLIIEKPSLAPMPNRIGWAFVTAFFWILWIYLWMPLITVVIWSLGFNAYGEYFYRISESQLDELKQVFLYYLGVIVVLCGTLLIWARTEFMRFRNVHRRTRPSPVELEELANFAQVAPVTMAELGLVRRMIVHHDDYGKFLYADILDPAGPDDEEAWPRVAS